MRVLYVTLERARKTGGSTHVREIVRGLRGRGHEVEVLKIGHLAGAGGIKHSVFPRTRLLFQFANQIRRFEVVYVRLHPLAAPFLIMSRLCGRPPVVEVNGPPEELAISFPKTRYFGRLIHVYYRLMLASAGQIVAVNRWLANDLSKYVRAPVDVIPNAADPNVFFPTKSHDASGRYLVFFGSYAPWQGIPTILSAVADSNWPADLRVHFIGQGALEDRIREVADQNPLVTFEAGQEPEQLRATISAAEASLCLKEGVPWADPLKLYESLACGVPAIATPGEYSRIIERRDLGWVLSSGENPRELARIAQKLASVGPAERHRRSRACRAYIIENATWALRTIETERVLIRSARRKI